MCLTCLKQVGQFVYLYLYSRCVIDSFTEKAESDYVVKTFDYGIAARQVYGKGLELQVISDEETKAEVDIPKLPNNVFNTIMNNLAIGELASPEQGSISR